MEHVTVDGQQNHITQAKNTYHLKKQFLIHRITDAVVNFSKNKQKTPPFVLYFVYSKS